MTYLAFIGFLSTFSILFPLSLLPIVAVCVELGEKFSETTQTKLKVVVTILCIYLAGIYSSIVALLVKTAANNPEITYSWLYLVTGGIASLMVPLIPPFPFLLFILFYSFPSLAHYLYGWSHGWVGYLFTL